MSVGKIACLALYAVLIGVAVTQVGTTVGTGAAGILLALAVSHVIEMALYYRLCQQASGSLAGNLLSVFLYGYFHTVEMKAQQPAADSEETS